MYLRRELLVSTLLAGPLLAGAAADPLDCNRMAPVVSGILVDQMQITRYLAHDTAAAADATFQLNYFHTERREYHRVFCSAVIRFSPIRFSEAERQSVALDATEALHWLARIAPAGLARYADFPSGLKAHYRLELMDNGQTLVVTLPGDPAADHVCALPDRDRYLADDRLCSSSLGRELQWRRSGGVDPGLLVPALV